MSTILVQRKLVIKKSPIEGYGVFADEELKENELIEECYSLERKVIEPEFNRYYFSTPTQDQVALPLGYGCIYNHSDHPNAGYQYYPEEKLLRFFARRDIKKGEEILISYGKNWFDSREMKKKEPLSYKLSRILVSTGFYLRFFIVIALLILAFFSIHYCGSSIGSTIKRPFNDIHN